MDPVKGKPDHINTPTSQTNQGGRIFFASDEKLSTNSVQVPLKSANLTTKELEAYVYTKLKLNKALETLLPDPTVFRRLLARVIIELQFNLEDPRLQGYMVKLIQQNHIPGFLLADPDKLEHLVRFLGTLVSLELENLEAEELFPKFLLFITGAEHGDQNPLTDSYLALIQYKGRIERKSYWWEYTVVEFSDGKHGMLQCLYGPEKQTPYKIVVTLPVESSNQDQRTVSYWWLEPERRTLFEHGLFLDHTSKNIPELDKQLLSQLKAFNFDRIQPRVQFPSSSADIRAKDVKSLDLDRGLDLFG